MITRTPLRDDPNAILTTAGIAVRWDDDEAVEEAMPALQNLVRIIARVVDRTHTNQQPAEADQAA